VISCDHNVTAVVMRWRADCRWALFVRSILFVCQCNQMNLSTPNSPLYALSQQWLLALSRVASPPTALLHNTHYIQIVSIMLYIHYTIRYIHTSHCTHKLIAYCTNRPIHGCCARPASRCCVFLAMRKIEI